ncbi:hypothetical protein [Psychrobacter phenylpyruvicus]|uniref:Uncharacterized protein n=1 Tax=Psychrobacter phenylpyruvicus TaxID=29432 RepID=A0A379LQH2_9GAMM|nr:hypothetical protein [Psychrobacter phenylpyruvicus]SUD92052.1 Uncharacterised protein [Psychrobacter phenylpyruvicus]
MPLKKFMLVFIPYIAFYIGYLIYEVTIGNNVDVKDWWPLALTFILLFHFVVTVVYCVIDKLYPSSYRYTVIYGLLLALPLAISLLINEVFYPIDWYAVNTGQVELTALQALFNSDLLMQIMTGLILLSHFLFRYSQRLKSGR